VDGAAVGTHGNGENGKRIGPRLAIEESGEGTRSTNGGNEDQIESRVEFLPDTARLRSSQGRPGRNVKQAGKIDGGPASPTPFTLCSFVSVTVPTISSNPIPRVPEAVPIP
jgi:hypothetical protein